MTASSLLMPAARTAGRSRNLHEVPFVELFDGRLQGVVSSESTNDRVYVCTFAGQTGDYSCNTNLNRPCGGLRGGPCKHIREMVAQAALAYGDEALIAYLRLNAPRPLTRAGEVLSYAGQQVKVPAGIVFSRFLDQLQLLRCPTVDGVDTLSFFTI